MEITLDQQYNDGEKILHTDINLIAMQVLYTIKHGIIETVRQFSPITGGCSEGLGVL